MSINPIIRECLAAGTLLPWEIGFDGSPSKRCLFITPQIHAELDPATWVEPALGLRYGQLAADFDRFAEGHNIPVAMAPYDKESHAFLARIDPVQYGIWTLRSVDPSPAIRVFGAFIEPDHFVALFTALREDLDGPNGKKWAAARENAISMWDSLTRYQNRNLGDEIENYISTKTTAV
jgi:hypothetical protein